MKYPLTVMATAALATSAFGVDRLVPQQYPTIQAAVDAGTRPQTRIALLTPLIHLDKTAIVRRGVALRAPLHLTWSCYVASEKACGRCESCLLRRRGFDRAGVAAPCESGRVRVYQAPHCLLGTALLSEGDVLAPERLLAVIASH